MNLQRYLKIFGEKTKNKNFEQSHSAEKCKMGAFWAFSTSKLLQNIKKLKGGPLETRFETNLTVPKQIERWDILVSSSFACIIVQFPEPNGTIWPL